LFVVEMRKRWMNYFVTNRNVKQVTRTDLLQLRAISISPFAAELLPFPAIAIIYEFGRGQKELKPGVAAAAAPRTTSFAAAVPSSHCPRRSRKAHCFVSTMIKVC